MRQGSGFEPIAEFSSEFQAEALVATNNVLVAAWAAKEEKGLALASASMSKMIRNTGVFAFRSHCPRNCVRM